LKLVSIVVEKMLPLREGNRVNFTFDLMLDDPELGSPYFPR
jgi:hypothetical protein